MDNSEFYIGWQPKAPQSFAKHIRKVIFAVVVLVITASLVLALQQRKFSTASFEFGKLTEVKGIYQKYPVPSLKVITSQDAFGNTSYITMPLVGYGKFGSEGVIAELEKESNASFEKKEITFRGTLIYSDGKTLLQIDKHDHPMINVSTTEEKLKPVIKDLGAVVLTGEIIDPKCYFGVMKPGHGKPHRDCAIRCIEGGMSPVFYVRNEKGETDYYLLVGANGEKINDELKDYVGEPVSLAAKAIRYDDWVVLYVNENTKIKRTGGLSWFKTNDATVSCRPSSHK
jgi:hypothetical protein